MPGLQQKGLLAQRELPSLCPLHHQQTVLMPSRMQGSFAATSSRAYFDQYFGNSLPHAFLLCRIRKVSGSAADWMACQMQLRMLRSF